MQRISGNEKSLKSSDNVVSSRFERSLRVSYSQWPKCVWCRWHPSVCDSRRASSASQRTFPVEVAASSANSVHILCAPAQWWYSSVPDRWECRACTAAWDSRQAPNRQNPLSWRWWRRNRSHRKTSSRLPTRRRRLHRPKDRRQERRVHSTRRGTFVLSFSYELRRACGIVVLWKINLSMFLIVSHFSTSRLNSLSDLYFFAIKLTELANKLP